MLPRQGPCSHTVKAKLTYPEREEQGRLGKDGRTCVPFITLKGILESNANSVEEWGGVHAPGKATRKEWRCESSW